MASVNPFDLLGDADSDDPSLLLAAQEQKLAAKKPAAAAASLQSAKLPSKPLPPQQAVREEKASMAPARGSVSRGGLSRGRGGRSGGSWTGPNREFANGDAIGNSRSYGRADFDGDKPTERGSGGYGPQRPAHRGGWRNGYGNGDAVGESERPTRRMYDRNGGTGQVYQVKQDGAGRSNWGAMTEGALEQRAAGNGNVNEKDVNTEKLLDQEKILPPEVNKDDKEGQQNKEEEKEPEDKEMTLDEYEKVREEKRKALPAMKIEERKVKIDKDLQSMKQLSMKKEIDVFIKVGSDKDVGKKREADREERVKKAVSINEFLKPDAGDKYYSGGRGRGRGRDDRGSFRGGFGGRDSGNRAAAFKIEDARQFPILGGK